MLQCPSVHNSITITPLLGAVMFRGYEIQKGIEFQDVVQCFEPNLCDEYRGTSPRRLIPGTKVLVSDSLSFIPSSKRLSIFFSISSMSSQLPSYLSHFQLRNIWRCLFFRLLQFESSFAVWNPLLVLEGKLHCVITGMA